MTEVQAERIARLLELDLDDAPICLACLSFVSMAIDEGNERKVRAQVRQMSPDLWGEGLELPAWTALERARERGVPGAAEALEDVAAHGPRSRVVEAIVRRLGAQLSERAQGDPLKMGFEPWPPPELA